MNSDPTWGICATILAPADEILRFAAFHLTAGAHRLYLYLDDENPTAYAALKAHPKIRVTTCNQKYWQKQNNGRPAKHQVRQTINATRAYRHQTDVDWLIHMDVDEFLVSKTPIGQHLAGLPVETAAARVRPMEAMSGDGTAFKAFIPAGPARARIVDQLYPNYGKYLKGGFLSHLAGKVFVRTGQKHVRVQIHNAFQQDTIIAAVESPQADIALAHCHAKTWDQWIAAYRYRMAQGSYRAELAPNKPRDAGGLSVHEVFQAIEQDSGEPGLRAFFDEICADTPHLRKKLAALGLLHLVNLDLDVPLSTHFPNHPF